MSECVIRARGLPWAVTPDDIAVFFAGCDIKGGKLQGVHIVINEEGRPSGECYVELLSEADMKRGLEKNHHYLGKRYIEVYESSVSEMKSEVDKTPEGKPKLTEPVVRLRGLPFKSTDADISQFFEGLNITELQLCQNAKGECSGEAFVEFASLEDTVKALEKHKEKIDWRYIEVFKSSRRDWRTGPSLGGGGGKRGPRPSPYDRGERRSGGPTGRSGYDSFGQGGYRDERGGLSLTGKHLVLMRGLPFKATEGDIIKFFAPNMPKQVEILFDHTGRPSGEAYVDFYTHPHALTAMKKDKETMGHRYIELFLESQEEEQHTTAAPVPCVKHLVLMRGLPFKASEGDIIKFFAPNMPKQVEILLDKTNRPSGEAYADFYTHADAVTAMDNNNKEIGTRYIELFNESVDEPSYTASATAELTTYPTYNQQGYNMTAYGGFENQSYETFDQYGASYSAATQETTMGYVGGW